MKVEDIVMLATAAQWLARLTHPEERFNKLFPDRRFPRIGESLRRRDWR